MILPPSGKEVVRRLSFLCLVSAVIFLPLMLLLGSDDAPAAVIPAYLVSLSGLLGWCLLFVRSEAPLVRCGLIAAITSAFFVCYFYMTIIKRHLRNREGITRLVVPERTRAENI